MRWNVLAYSSDSKINLPTRIAGKADKIHNSAVHESVTTEEQTVERTQMAKANQQRQNKKYQTGWTAEV